MFEKVDKLRERANVSYEEAKQALERANGDILDAMIILEREGKTRKEGNGIYSTNGTESTACVTACDNGQAKRGAAGENGRSFGDKIKELFRKSTVNYLVIERNGKNVVEIPVFAVILIVLLAWYAAIVAVVVSLFCDCKYSFVGEGDLEAANNVCDKAENLASQVKEKVVDEYNKL